MKTKLNSETHLMTAVILLAIMLLVNISFNASAQTTLLSEDFESGSTGWTFTVNSGGTDNYWEVSNGTCSNGTSQLMVRRNNNNCTYRNNRANDVTASIAIDASGYNNLTLDFDWVCNGEAGYDYGQVYYSLDGSSWTLISTGGVSGVYQGTTTWGSESDIVLPADLDDQSFYLGFNWQNDGSLGSFPAFGVDNIEVKGVVIPVAPPSAPKSGIFSEDFSGTGLPSGWTNTDQTGNSAGTWSFTNPGGRTINTTTQANGFAIFDSDDIGQDSKAENAELVTPAFDCSSYAIVTMELEHYFRYYLPSHYQIAISNNNGSSYSTLALDSAETANAATWSADISAYAAGFSQVKLKFTYTGSYGYYWAIDDILVEGTAADSAAWTGAVNTNWNLAGNWSNNNIPTTSTAVLIPAAAVRMPFVGSAVGAAAFNLTIESGATITVATDSSQGGNLTITGNLTCNGTINNTGNAYIRLAGADKLITGNYTGGNDVQWKIENGASYLLSGDLTTYGLHIADGGSLDMNGYNISVYSFEQYGTLSMGSSTLEIAGSQAAFTKTTLDAGTSTVYFNSGGATWAAKPTVSQTVPDADYYDLQVKANGGYSATLGNGNSLTVTNNLTVMDTDTTGGAITTGSDLLVMGDITVGHEATTDLTFTINDRIIGGGSSSSLIMPSAGAGNQMTISYTDVELAALNNFLGSGMQLNFPIEYSGSGDQMIVPLDYNNLSLSGSGTKALGADMTIDGNLSISSVTLTTTISMINEVISNDNDVAVPYTNGGAANNNTAPALATLISDAVSMTVDVPAGLANYQVSGLKLTLPHTYNSDVDIYLVSPGGTVYTLSTDNGGNGTGYDNAQFSDAGAGTFPNNSVLDGHYRPEGFTFAALPTPISGTWTLYAIDDANNDDGTLTDFSLQLKEGSVYADLNVKGNWVVSSGGSFTAGNGSVTLNGSSQQQVSTNGSSFYQLTVNNSAGIKLNDNLTVTNTLALTSGVVSTGANKLIMTSTTAANLTAYGQTAFVNGNLRRYIASNTSTYYLPVGNGTTTSNYKLAQLTNNLLTGVTYLDVYFNSLQNHNDLDMNVTDGGMAITRMHPSGTWVIEPNAQPILGTYSVKLSLSGFNGLTDNEFVVLKRSVGSTSGADWSAGGGLLNIVNGLGRLLSDGFAMRTGLSSFSEFGVGDGSGGGASLPIELLSFTATETPANQVQLDWATAVEINNDHFTVERSVDGKEWQALFNIAGARTSNQQRNYQAFDVAPYSGTSYYRLKQTDTDGSYTYSDLQKVNFSTPTIDLKARLYPNPSNGVFQIDLKGLEENGPELYIGVSNMQGQLVFSTTTNADYSIMEQQFSLQDKLQAGNYIVHITQGKRKLVKRLTIQ